MIIHKATIDSFLAGHMIPGFDSSAQMTSTARYLAARLYEAATGKWLCPCRWSVKQNANGDWIAEIQKEPAVKEFKRKVS